MSESGVHVNVLVLGGGPGGYVAAIRAAQLGLSVAIVEREYWGGVCLNIGCIPTKVLLRHAEVATIVSRQASLFGLPEGVSADFTAAHQRSRVVVDGRVKGVHYLMKKNGIQQFSGTGVFSGPHSLDVSDDEESVAAQISFDHAVIATGSVIRTIPGVELGAHVTGYTELVLAERMPKRLGIIGAGPIGIEFASIASSFGTEVTLIEYQDRILPLEDAEVSAELAKALKKNSITIVTSARVDSAKDSGDAAEVTYSSNGDSTTLEFDHVMVAVGFAPQLDGFGLANTDIAVSEAGAIVIDDQMRTSVPHFFAIGDVTGKLALAHVAEAQGILAAEVIAGQTSRTMGDYRMMPRAVYSLPQVASFGLTEEQAREEFGDVIVAKFPFVANGKAHAFGETHGFVKLVADAQTRHLVGGHLIGPEVSELLPELTLAAQQGVTIDDLVLNVHAHPTLNESLQEAFHGLAGHMINF